jgi:hypothetical protein
MPDQRKVLSRGRWISDSGDEGADDPGNQQLQGDQQQHADHGNDQHTDIISGVLEDEMEGFQKAKSFCKGNIAIDCITVRRLKAYNADLVRVSFINNLTNYRDFV